MSSIQQQANVTSDPAIVETIVRRVMERLAELKLVNHQGESGPREKDRADKTPGQVLELNDQVITLENIRGRLQETKTLVVKQKAVVTPAVHDELRSRGIKLETRRIEQSASQSGEPFCLARLSSHFIPVDWLKNVGLCEVCCGEDFEQIANKLGGEQANGKTICFAAQPYVAVSILNRNNSLRAAFGRTLKEVNEIKSTLKANVLVLDAVQSRKELLELIHCFVNSQGTTRIRRTNQ